MKNVFCTHYNQRRSLKVEIARWQDTGNRLWVDYQCSSCGRIWRERR